MKRTLLGLAMVCFWPVAFGLATWDWAGDPCRTQSAERLNRHPELRALWERNQLRARALEIQAESANLADAFAVNDGRLTERQADERAARRFEIELTALQRDRGEYQAACRVLVR